MKDEDLTKEQLLHELHRLRQEIYILKSAPIDDWSPTAESDLPASKQDFLLDKTEIPFSEPPEKIPANNQRTEYTFSDLVDLSLLQRLLNSFYDSTGIPYTIIDAENNILGQVGWQDICARFHRTCPQTEVLCKQSDSYIAAHIHDAPYIGYKCLNGLMDYAAPIIIDGQHLATFFHGQVLHESPDEELFRYQARKYGFDETLYMEALRRVPVIPEDQMESIMFFYSQLGQVLAIVGMERKRQLEAAEECFAKAFNANPILMAISSLEHGKFIMVNDAFCRITGYSRKESIGKTSLDLGLWADPANYQLAKQTITEKQTIHNQEICFVQKSGERRWGLYSAESLVVRDEPCVISILSDITDIKEIEHEMAQLDRLNTIGEMAASIGHEIRNPMTTVRGYLQLLKENENYAKEFDSFDLMIEEMDRANLIITEFLSLAKDKIVDRRPRNLNTIIRKMLPLLQAKATSRDHYIKLELNDLPNLFLDKKEIRQLIHNLVNNGMESMSSPGVITIKTFMEKETVILAVNDQGHGIENDLLDKLGMPFFTTKEQGTGLGLAVCYRIAAHHNAQIAIETDSSGSTFFVNFPILPDLPQTTSSTAIMAMTTI